MQDQMTPDTTKNPTEVKPRVTRRRFSAKFKKRILDEVAKCRAPGEVGALLRREGLYSSHLTKWRRQAQKGELAGLAAKKRGPASKAVDPRDKKLVEVGKALDKMTRRAERAEALVELQKKLSELLGIVLPSPRDEP